jgi:hypothetical protein
MADIKAPGWVREQLLDGEEIVSKALSARAIYYATNRRVLRFGGKSRRSQSLQYNQVSSIIFTRYGAGWRAFNAFSVFLGLIIILVGVLTAVVPDLKIEGQPLGTIVPIVAIAGGVVLIFAALCFHYAYYQFCDPSSEKSGKNNLKKWRIERSRWGGVAIDVDRFVEVVKSRSGI